MTGWRMSEGTKDATMSQKIKGLEKRPIVPTSPIISVLSQNSLKYPNQIGINQDPTTNLELTFHIGQ